MNLDFLKPDCARCGRPVDRMEVDRDLSTDRLTFMVRCHGETARFVVDAEFLLAGPVSMEPVFQEQPKLASPALPEAR